MTIKPRLINADALKKAIEQYQIQWNRNREYDVAQWDCCESILAIIDDTPAVERPTGDWYYSCQKGWHCSICQQIVKDMPTVMGKANFDYCPHCGAKMEV